MPHNASFHEGPHCLLVPRQSSEREKNELVCSNCCEKISVDLDLGLAQRTALREDSRYSERDMNKILELIPVEHNSKL